MKMEQIKKIMSNRFAQWALFLILGFGIGLILNPSKKEYEQTIAQMTVTHQQEIKQIQNEAAVQVEKLILQSQNTEQSYKLLIAELNTKITSISQENKQLKQISKVVTYKIVKPDGTIIEKSDTQTSNEEISNITKQLNEELNQKIAQTEQQLKQKYETMQKDTEAKYTLKIDTLTKQYEEEISSLKETHTITTNEKKLGVAFGIKTDLKAYTGISYDFWGPVFVDSHFGIDKNKNWEAGVGLGVRF